MSQQNGTLSTEPLTREQLTDVQVECLTAVKFCLSVLGMVMSQPKKQLAGAMPDLIEYLQALEERIASLSGSVPESSGAAPTE